MKFLTFGEIMLRLKSPGFGALFPESHVGSNIWRW